MNLETFALVFEATGGKELEKTIKRLNAQLDKFAKTRTAHLKTVNETVNKTVNQTVDKHKTVEKLERSYNEKVKKSYNEKINIQKKYDEKVRYDEKVNIERKMKQQNVDEKIMKERLRGKKQELTLGNQLLKVFEKQFRSLLGIRAIGGLGAAGGAAMAVGAGLAVAGAAAGAAKSSSASAASTVAQAGMFNIAPQTLTALRGLIRSRGGSEGEADTLLGKMREAWFSLMFNKDSEIYQAARQAGFTPSAKALESGNAMDMLESLFDYFSKLQEKGGASDKDKNFIANILAGQGIPPSLIEIMREGGGVEKFRSLLSGFEEYATSNEVLKELAKANEEWVKLGQSATKFIENLGNLFNQYIGKGNIRRIADVLSLFADKMAGISYQFSSTPGYEKVMMTTMPLPYFLLKKSGVLDDIKKTSQEDEWIKMHNAMNLGGGMPGRSSYIMRPTADGAEGNSTNIGTVNLYTKEAAVAFVENTGLSGALSNALIANTSRQVQFGNYV